MALAFGRLGDDGDAGTGTGARCFFEKLSDGLAHGGVVAGQHDTDEVLGSHVLHTMFNCTPSG